MQIKIQKNITSRSWECKYENVRHIMWCEKEDQWDYLLLVEYKSGKFIF
jgi:hypothetical protein